MDYLCGKRGRPLRWTNYWDRMDAVSDPLYTPLGGKTSGAAVVTTNIENIEVRNSPGINTVSSHTRYLDNPTVVEDIYYSLLGGVPPTAPRRRHYNWRRADIFRRVSLWLSLAALALSNACPIVWPMFGTRDERMTLFTQVAAISGTALLVVVTMLLIMEKLLSRWLDFNRAGK